MEFWISVHFPSLKLCDCPKAAVPTSTVSEAAINDLIFIFFEYIPEYLRLRPGGGKPKHERNTRANLANLSIFRYFMIIPGIFCRPCLTARRILPRVDGLSALRLRRPLFPLTIFLRPKPLSPDKWMQSSPFSGRSALSPDIIPIVWVPPPISPDSRRP